MEADPRRLAPSWTPLSTYRLQIGRNFDLAATRKLLPYLEALGVDTLYTSPLLAARPGSLHGYDLVDPGRIDPEIGGMPAFDELTRGLASRGMGLLLDIVVNHMSASLDNPWWHDLLERGRSSPWAAYFDIDWEALERHGEKLVLPVLGAPWGEVLESQELHPVVGPRGLALQYHEHLFPLAVESYQALLEEARRELHPAGAAAAAVAELLESPDPETLRRGLLDRYQREPALRELLDRALEGLKGEPGRPESYLPLERLMAAQHYRLAFWRLAAEQLPYRRFFDITELVGLRVELPEVFDALHGLLAELFRDGRLQGLRIDHIDGLRRPRRYLARLQERLGGDRGLYVVVEKILGAGEPLPAEWPCHGTTGYELLGELETLFVEPRGLAILDRFYRAQTGRESPFEEVRYRRKRQVLEELFGSELDRLSLTLAELAREDLSARDVPPGALKGALAELTACLPIYRTYFEELALPERDRPFLEEALAEARRRQGEGALSELALSFLARLLLLEPGGISAPGAEALEEPWLSFLLDWQQLTGAVMAKGFEDTTLYVYNRLLSLNEVGGEPEGLGPPGDVAAFHRRMEERLRRWPAALSASSTHDSKRSEDVQARIDVLSEMPREWWRAVLRWEGLTADLKGSQEGRPVPDSNETLYLYQTLLGSWPLEEDDLPSYPDRIAEHMVKALREAKTHSSWYDPDEGYEGAVTDFARALIAAPEGAPFRREFAALCDQVAWYGAMGSLSRLLVKTTVPGVPDTYQGCELWQLTLVDPDNRRPVDFVLRRALLEELQARQGDPTLLPELLSSWRDGRVKLWLTWRALFCRRADPELFHRGDYLPLEVSGPRSRHLVAFARRLGERWLLAVAPRWLTSFTEVEGPPLGAEAWAQTVVRLPRDAPGNWRDTLAPGEPEIQASGHELPVASALAHFPVGLLVGPKT